MNLPDGTLLQGGKYKIVRFISSGGFGCTYKAEHVMLQTEVAIKEFFVKDFCNRDETTAHVTVGTTSKKGLVNKLRGKFIDEARAIYRMSHPNIVRVSDVFEENGTAYYVMDFINGMSLTEIVKNEGHLSERRALKYIRQVADALKYVHKQNRLHLDVKPSNIMIDSHDNAILIDFGTSKQYDEADGENTSTLMGKTPGYAPIEQMGNDVVRFTPATDIYALGATLYKLLTGVTPLGANLLASGEALAPLPSGTSPNVANAISSAMQINKTQRPQDIDKFLTILNDVDGRDTDGDEDTVIDTNQKRPEKQIQVTPTPPPTPPKKGRSCMFVVAIILIIFTTIIVVVMCAGGKGSTNDKNGGVLGNSAPVNSSPVDAVAVDSAYADSTYVDYVETKPVEVVDKTTGYINGHEYVDLGLSVKWATCNVGASSPSDYGNYYAWGETSTKSSYTDNNSLTYGKNMGSIAGNSTYDAARANWGGTWRLPTIAEIDELVNKCKWQWTTQGGHRGYKVTGPNGNSIFLPAAGWRHGASLDYAGEGGGYWSATPDRGKADGAYSLDFASSYFCGYWNTRYYGQSVRPVSE